MGWPSTGTRCMQWGIPDCFVENVGDWTQTRQSIGLDVPGVMQAIRELLD